MRGNGAYQEKVKRAVIKTSYHRSPLKTDSRCSKVNEVMSNLKDATDELDMYLYEKDKKVEKDYVEEEVIH